MRKFRCDYTREENGVPTSGNIYEVTDENPEEIMLLIYGDAKTEDLHLHMLGDKMMLLTALMVAVERLSEGIPGVEVRRLRLGGKEDDHE